MILRALRFPIYLTKSINITRLYRTEPAKFEPKICFPPTNCQLNFLSYKDASCLNFTNSSIVVGCPKPILDIPTTKVPSVIPNKINTIINDILPVLNEIDCPTSGNVIEKKAQRMIIQRRRKMKKHQLKKWRKKFKFVIRKRRHRLELNKEKAFQAALLSRIKAAEEFDPEKYVTEKLKKAADVPQFERYRRPPITSNIIFHPGIPEESASKK